MRATVPPLSLTIASLAVTQIVGWGTTYYVPAVIAPALRANPGLSQQEIFSGVTLMLAVGALVAPWAGRFMERHGTRSAMTAGSLMMSLGLVLMSQAHGYGLYALAWVVIGLATPIALMQAALTSLAQRAGSESRKAVSRLLLVTGFAATIFWPLTTALESSLGWRATCLIFVGLNAGLCAPLHALVLRGRPAAPSSSAGGPATPERPVIHREREILAFMLCVFAFSLAGFVSAGLPHQLVEILTRLGQPAETAVGVAALLGPAGVAARALELTLGRRAGIMMIGVVAAATLLAAAVLPLLAGARLPVVVVFTVAFGAAAGVMTIVRSVLPLTLFGRERYARLLGQLALPQNLTLACAPLAFAFVMSRSGPEAVLGLAVAVALFALGAMIGLALLVRAP
jgi:predicted MFS family arabinose efflux permease